MSNPLKAALAKEEAKLTRQIENHEATKAVVEVLGETQIDRNKMDRQLEAIEQTKANIKKLEAAVKKLK